MIILLKNTYILNWKKTTTKKEIRIKRGYNDLNQLKLFFNFEIFRYDNVAMWISMDAVKFVIFFLRQKINVYIGYRRCAPLMFEYSDLNYIILLCIANHHRILPFKLKPYLVTPPLGIPYRIFTVEPSRLISCHNFIKNFSLP